MENHEFLHYLLKQGKVAGYLSIPKVIETVISRVYVFDQENLVLKFYKRDNSWWNESMRDLSTGKSRADFIRQDFVFNNFLNPKIYLSIKAVVIRSDQILLTDPVDDDDELVIVMAKQDFNVVLTDVLFSQSLVVSDYSVIGQEFARTKLAIPKSFLPKVTANWHEQMLARLQDLKSWIESEKNFPEDLREKGLARLDMLLQKQKSVFQNVIQDDLFVCVDCNSENLIFDSGKLSFIDAYPPKDDWRIGVFDLDIHRTGADIYAVAGKEAFDSYMNGVREVAGGYLEPTLSDFYLLYGAMIASPYFVMLSKKNSKYIQVAEKYLAFTKSLLVD